MRKLLNVLSIVTFLSSIPTTFIVHIINYEEINYKKMEQISTLLDLIDDVEESEVDDVEESEVDDVEESEVDDVEEPRVLESKSKGSKPNVVKPKTTSQTSKPSKPSNKTKSRRPSLKNRNRNNQSEYSVSNRKHDEGSGPSASSGRSKGTGNRLKGGNKLIKEAKDEIIIVQDTLLDKNINNFKIIDNRIKAIDEEFIEYATIKKEFADILSKFQIFKNFYEEFERKIENLRKNKVSQEKLDEIINKVQILKLKIIESKDKLEKMETKLDEILEVTKELVEKCYLILLQEKYLSSLLEYKVANKNYTEVLDAYDLEKSNFNSIDLKIKQEKVNHGMFSPELIKNHVNSEINKEGNYLNLIITKDMWLTISSMFFKNYSKSFFLNKLEEKLNDDFFKTGNQFYSEDIKNCAFFIWRNFLFLDKILQNLKNGGVKISWKVERNWRVIYSYNKHEVRILLFGETSNSTIDSLEIEKKQVGKNLNIIVDNLSIKTSNLVNAKTLYFINKIKHEMYFFLNNYNIKMSELNERKDEYELKLLDNKNSNILTEYNAVIKEQEELTKKYEEYKNEIEELDILVKGMHEEYKRILTEYQEARKEYEEARKEYEEARKEYEDFEKNLGANKNEALVAEAKKNDAIDKKDSELKLVISKCTWLEIVNILFDYSKINYKNILKEKLKNFMKKSNKITENDMAILIDSLEKDFSSYYESFKDLNYYYQGVIITLDTSKYVIKDFRVNKNDIMRTEVYGEKFAKKIAEDKYNIMKNNIKKRFDEAQKRFDEAQKRFDEIKNKKWEKENNDLKKILDYQIESNEKELNYLQSKIKILDVKIKAKARIFAKIEFEIEREKYDKINQDFENKKRIYFQIKEKYELQKEDKSIEQEFVDAEKKYNEAQKELGKAWEKYYPIQNKFNSGGIDLDEEDEDDEDDKQSIRIYNQYILESAKRDMLYAQLMKEVFFREYKILEEKYAEAKEKYNKLLQNFGIVQKEKIEQQVLAKNNIVEKHGTELKLTIEKPIWSVIVGIFFHFRKSVFLNKLVLIITQNFVQKGDKIVKSDIRSLAYLIWKNFAYYFNLFWDLTDNYFVEITSDSKFPEGFFDEKAPWTHNKVFGKNYSEITDPKSRTYSEIFKQLQESKKEYDSLTEKYDEETRKYEEIFYTFTLKKFNFLIENTKAKIQIINNGNDIKEQLNEWINSINNIYQDHKKAEFELRGVLLRKKEVENNINDIKNKLKNIYLNTIEKEDHKLKLKLTKYFWSEEIWELFRSNSKKVFLDSLLIKLKLFNKKGDKITESDIKSLVYLIWKNFAYYSNLFLDLSEDREGVIITSDDRFPEGFFDEKSPWTHNKVFSIGYDEFYFKILQEKKIDLEKLNKEIIEIIAKKKILGRKMMKEILKYNITLDTITFNAKKEQEENLLKKINNENESLFLDIDKISNFKTEFNFDEIQEFIDEIQKSIDEIEKN